MAEIKAAKKEDRTISASTMASVMEFVPRDGFKLKSELLDQEYVVTRVTPTEFNKIKSFTITLERDGVVINLPASAFKKARMLGKDIEVKDVFEENEHVILRSKAQELWNSSRFVHETESMKKNEEYIIPDKLYLHSAVLQDDRDAPEGEEKAALNPFYYKGYNKVLAAYQAREAFPMMDDFKEELLKTKEDGRIDGLPANLTEPVAQDWVDLGDIANYRHNLVFRDIAD